MKGIVKCTVVLLMMIGLILSVGVPSDVSAQSLKELAQSRENRVVDTTSKAPTGSYTATTGGTATSVTGGGAGKRLRKMKSTEATAGNTVSMTISSYSPREEIDAVANAGQGNMATVMSSYNHGSIMLGEKNYVVNMATSSTVGSNYVIHLFSAKPFSGTGQNANTGTGVSMGMIELTIPAAGGPGTGKMYSSTAVAFSTDGSVKATGKASSATALSDVAPAN